MLGTGAGAWGAGANGQQAHGRAKRTVQAWARLCTLGCAQLGQVGCFVHSDSVFDPV